MLLWLLFLVSYVAPYGLIRSDIACENRAQCLTGPDDWCASGVLCNAGRCAWAVSTPCPSSQACDAEEEVCAQPLACLDDGACQNGLFCDGQERCLDGRCAPALDACVGGVCSEIDRKCVLPTVLQRGGDLMAAQTPTTEPTFNGTTPPPTVPVNDQTTTWVLIAVIISAIVIAIVLIVVLIAIMTRNNTVIVRDTGGAVPIYRYS